MPADAVVKTILDPDFGQLTLLETRDDDGAANEVWSPPPVSRSWIGEKGPDRSFHLSFTATDDPLQVSDAMRARFRQTTADIDAVRAQVAAIILPGARKWAETAGRSIALDEAGLAALLRLDAVEVSTNRLTCYFADAVDIFADFLIEVQLNPAGDITKVGLAG